MATDARFRDTLKILLATLGSPEPTRWRKARRTIRDTLALNQKSWSALTLFASKLTLAYNSLVSFGGASDPILKLAVSRRQLLGYYVAAADCTAVYDVRGKRDSLARTKFMVCH